MTVIATCGSCPTRWAGAFAAHCATCHLTFTSVGPFDEHRLHGRCRTGTELAARGLAPNGRGHWRRPRPDNSWHPTTEAARRTVTPDR